MGLATGDERPCQRCIKRGLADACQDGIRKKAKYLHDAPVEALRPVLGPLFDQDLGTLATRPQGISPVTELSPSTPSMFTQADVSPSYAVYSTQMPPPLQTRFSYSSHPSPISAGLASSAQPDIGHVQLSPRVHETPNAFGGDFFDNSSPAVFPYDLGDLRFDNQYGAMEFSMLARMSAAVSAPDPTTMLPPQLDFNLGNDSRFNSDLVSYGPQPFPSEGVSDYLPGDSTSMYTGGYQQIPIQAYSIATASHASPSTEASPGTSLGFDSPSQYDASPATVNRTLRSQEPRFSANTRHTPGSVLGKRPRDASWVYEDVTEPYSYTAGFHGLTACLQRRFSPATILRIAKSLASIRPSFIACTKSLNRQDLIFMETCFQRTLIGYDECLLHCCTPTLVCRRTGEVATVNKEFTLLTGWKKDVLLGSQPNLNINTGQSTDESVAGGGDASTSSTTRTAPRMRPLLPADGHSRNGKPQPVFLAELLDEEGVIDFYDNFAKLAFGDARGSVNSRCKLLKYRTKEMSAPSPPGTNVNNHRHNKPAIRGRGIENEEGFNRLEKDGKMDCSYCWTVKRDVFDIPMLIVMNVSFFVSWLATRPSAGCCCIRESLLTRCLVFTVYLTPGREAKFYWRRRINPTMLKTRTATIVPLQKLRLWKQEVWANWAIQEYHHWAALCGEYACEIMCGIGDLSVSTYIPTLTLSLSIPETHYEGSTG